LPPGRSRSGRSFPATWVRAAADGRNGAQARSKRDRRRLPGDGVFPTPFESSVRAIADLRPDGLLGQGRRTAAPRSRASSTSAGKRQTTARHTFSEALRFDPAISLPEGTSSRPGSQSRVRGRPPSRPKVKPKAPEAAAPVAAPEGRRGRRRHFAKSVDGHGARGKCSPDAPDCGSRQEHRRGMRNGQRLPLRILQRRVGCTTEGPSRKTKYKKKLVRDLGPSKTSSTCRPAEGRVLQADYLRLLAGQWHVLRAGAADDPSWARRDNVRAGLAVCHQPPAHLVRAARSMDSFRYRRSASATAFGGGPTTPSGAAFHSHPTWGSAGLRSGTGSEPFARPGLRAPYFVASFGFAQVDTGVDVVVIETMQKGSLTAWTRSALRSPSGGLGFLPTRLGHNNGLRVSRSAGKGCSPTAGTVIPRSRLG